VSVAAHTDVVVDVTVQWWRKPTEASPFTRFASGFKAGFAGRLVHFRPEDLTVPSPRLSPDLVHRPRSGCCIIPPCPRAVRHPFRRQCPVTTRVARLRVPPHSVEAEQSVLGGLLLDNSAWDRAADLLTDSDFYRHEHQLIYRPSATGQRRQAGRRDHGVRATAACIGKADDCGGLGYLNALAQSVPSAANMRRYAEIVRERAVLRKLIAASDEIATNAFNPQGKTVDADPGRGRRQDLEDRRGRQRASAGLPEHGQAGGRAAGPRQRTGTRTAPRT
jgi:hypothetical protein